MSKDIKIEQINENLFILRNVPLVYTHVRKHVERDIKKDGVVIGRAKEYEVTAIIPEDIADEWDGLGLTSPDSKKVIRKDEDKTFEDRYKMEKPDWVTDKKNFTLTFRQGATRKVDGEEVFWEDNMNARPKVEMMVDGARTNVTDKMIGNGSVGDIAIKTYQSVHGTHAKLGGIMLKDLVEVEMKSGYVDPFAEYGEAPEIPDFESSADKTTSKVESSNKEAEKLEGISDKPSSGDSNGTDFEDDIPF